MDLTTAELLFMGTEYEASGFETFDAIRDIENLDTETAIERTQVILAWLASRSITDLFLGNPFTYEPDPHDCDSMDTNPVCADRLWLRDDPGDRRLLYDATPRSRLMPENRWVILRETERGSTS